MKAIFVISFYSLIIQSSVAELTRPVDGDTTFATHIVFEWEQVSQANVYNLVISDDPNFENIILHILDSTLIHIVEIGISWGSNYYWNVYPLSDANDTIEFYSPNQFFTGTQKMDDINFTIYDTSYNWNGVTIFSSWLDNFTCAIDKNGSEIWNDGGLGLMLNFIDEHGQMFGINGKQFNAFHDIIWQQSPGTLLNRHDLRAMENGNLYGFRPMQELGPIPLGWWTDYYQSLGYVADGTTLEYPWTGEKISVIDRETKQEIWSWNPFDYYSMNDVDSLGNTWWWNNTPTYDWLHSNSIFFDENESVFYISHRHISRISKVAYPSGELMWMMGLPEPYMASGEDHICTELLFSWQHDAEILENGNLLFFDNGNFSETYLEMDSPISRIIEISVTEEFTCDSVWIYDLEEELYSQGMGSVQELPNNNLLISSMGNGGTIFEMNREKEKLWEANLNLGQPVGSLYRAFIISSLFPNEFSVIIDGLETIEEDGSSYERLSLEIGDPLPIKISNETASEIDVEISVFVQLDNGSYSPISVPIETSIDSSVTMDIQIPIDNLSLGQRSLVIKTVPYPFYQDGKTVEITAMITDPLSIEDSMIPQTINLKQYPNPFNGETKFEYELIKDTFVEIIIYDILGCEIKTLVNQFQSTGLQSVKWDATNEQNVPVHTGIYFYKMNLGNFSVTNKLLYLK